MSAARKVVAVADQALAHQAEPCQDNLAGVFPVRVNRVASMSENVAELSHEERVERIKRMNFEAEEMRAEASRIMAEQTLKDAKRGHLWIAGMALSSMILGGGVLVFGMLLGRMMIK